MDIAIAWFYVTKRMYVYARVLNLCASRDTWRDFDEVFLSFFSFFFSPYYSNTFTTPIYVWRKYNVTRRAILTVRIVIFDIDTS